MKISLNQLKAAPFFAMGIMLSTLQASAQSWGNTNAQSDPFESQYFTNRYLANPAMAGMDSTLTLNAAYRKQFTDLPGAPVTEAFTADYNPGKRVGLGLIAYNDKAGLINRTRFALTYAYHLPVGEFGEQLHFGISAAFAHANLDTKGIIGDEPDPSVANFNGRKNAFEIDYGMAYTDTHITLQGALTNLIGYLRDVHNGTVSDVSTFYAAAAYKFTFDGAVNSLEPMVSLRGVKQYNSIVDVGANLIMFHHIFNIYTMFHSSGNFSTGVGLNYKEVIYIQGAYLSKIEGLRQYTDGNYEIDMTLSLFGKK